MRRHIIFIIIAGIIVLFTSIFSLIEINPYANWLQKEDSNRNFDYSIMTNAIRAYFTQQAKLPEALLNLKDMQKLSHDAKQYDYKILSNQSYQLCTSFLSATSNYQYPVIEKQYVTTNENFRHNKGYFCFTYYIEDSMLPVAQLMPVSHPTNKSVIKNCMIISTLYINDPVKIMGLYELDDTLVFTTNKVANQAIVEYWNPGLRGNITASYPAHSIYDLRYEDTSLKLYKGMEYKISVYNKDGSLFSTQDYSFQGNRIVLMDSRCMPLEK